MNQILLLPCDHQLISGKRPNLTPWMTFLSTRHLTKTVSSKLAVYSEYNRNLAKRTLALRTMAAETELCTDAAQCYSEIPTASSLLLTSSIMPPVRLLLFTPCTQLCNSRDWCDNGAVHLVLGEGRLDHPPHTHCCGVLNPLKLTHQL